MIDVASLEEQMNTVNKQIKELQKQNIETSKKVFHGAIATFFKTYPEVAAVRWTQYTPYFNDGDTCEFGVNSPTFTNAPDPENVNWGSYDGDEEGVFAVENISYVMNSDRDYYKNEQEAIKKAGVIDVDSCEAFQRMICSSAMEDVMEAMFGNHVKVIATRDGFDIQDYDHD